MARGERDSRYQLPFDFSAQPLDTSQHVRVVKEHYTVRHAADAASYLINSVYSPFEHFKQEQMYVLLLDNKNKITHDIMVYKGTINTIYVRVAELFMEAVKVNAPHLILSHLHPSGDPTPSPEDVRVTTLAYEAGQLLDIHVLDHIIVGNQVWVSLKERVLGFP